MHKNASPRHAASRTHRQDRILAAVRSGEPRSQGEILGRLRSQGIRVTQSTLSRDLRSLGLVKGPAGYREADDEFPAADPATRLAQMERLLRDHLTGAARAGNLVVLKTTAGMAHALGVALDRAALDDIVGTVAGDDTLFAATPDPRRARALERRLHGLIGRR
jgi:transcriptional regulator of arginine metabolism